MRAHAEHSLAPLLPRPRSPPPPPHLQVKLVDQCASCSCGDVDLSTRALESSTGFSWDRKRIEWEWDPDCSGGSSSKSNDSEDSSDSSDSSDKVRGSLSPCAPAPAVSVRARPPLPVLGLTPARLLPQCDEGYKWSKRKEKCYKIKDRRLLAEEA